MTNTEYNTVAYKELRASHKGDALIELSKRDAANFMFDLKDGELNQEAANELSATTIYDAVMLSSSLAIEVDGKQYELEPYFPHLTHDDALAMLQDVQSSIESSLFEAALMNDSEYQTEIFPSATKLEILDVMLQDVIGEYEHPDDVPEWSWIEEKACYSHRRNGQDGIWEFVVNLSYGINDIPGKLKPVIAAANKADVRYILFHQGT